jgi:hypothetical protein
MVQSNINLYLYYDLHASPILPVPLVGFLTTTDILVDTEKGYLYCLGSTGITTFGVGIVDGNETLAAPGGLTVTNSAGNSTGNSTSNSTTNGTNGSLNETNSSVNGTNSSVNGST